MKKTYIQPDMLTVRLNVADSILIVSKPGEDTTGITLSDDDGDGVNNPDNVWVKGSKGLWDDEW